MDNVHGAHGAARIVEHPLLVQVDIARRSSGAVEFVNNVAHNAARVVAMCSDAALDKVVQVVWLEDVEGLKVLLEEVEDGAQQAYENGQQGEGAGHFYCPFVMMLSLFLMLLQSASMITKNESN